MLPAMDIREKMKRDWDRRARIDPMYWVAATQEADEASYHASAEKDVAALVDGLDGCVGAEARALDLGCGIGRMTGPMGAHFAEVVGVDVSGEMIEQAKRLHADLPNVSFATNSGADLADFADQSFDLVVSYSVLPHIPVDVVTAYFGEVNRILKPGGWYRYQFWVGPERQQADNDTLNIRVYSPEDFSRLNAQAGFDVKVLTDIDYLDPVLELRPVWVNAQRIGAAAETIELGPTRAATFSSEERRLEYQLLLHLAIRQDEQGNRDAAESVLEEAIQTDPGRAEAYVEWVRHRYERGDLAGGLKLIVALNENVPDEALGWLYRAQVELELEHPGAAKAALDRFDATNDDPTLASDAKEIRQMLPKPTKKKRVKKRLKKR